MNTTNRRDVILFGARGFMGQRFLELYPDALTPSLDIADQRAVREVLSARPSSVVINCAGKCGVPNVDWCEDHKLETVHANVLGPLVLLEECSRGDHYFVHLSSGCIYQGDNNGVGYRETDVPNYHDSFYSRTKATADQMLKDFPVLSLRLRMPFDGSTSDRNLLMKLRKYQRVLTAENSITYVADFLDAADHLIQQRAVGVFNIVNPGAISPHEIMSLYKDIVDPSHSFVPLAVEQLGEVAKAGRSSCVLNYDKAREAGIHLPPVREAVATALRELATKLGRA